MASYGSALRRCTKWYRKLMIELLWGTTLVNAYFLYSEYSRMPKMTITTFREIVIDAMLMKYASIPEPPSTPAPKVTQHLLVDNLVRTPPKMKRGRCKNCYTKCGKKGKAQPGQREFAAQVTTICSVCKFIYCRPCFNEVHSK